MPASTPHNGTDYYIEVYRPSFQTQRSANNKIKTRIKIHRGRGFCVDELHPSMTALFHVHGVQTQDEAIARVLESAAGVDVPEVRRIIVHERNLSALPPEG